ncbi:MAG: hypothetical protein Q4D07_07120 [Selenomonadaceae bacterium]|nr:hypothetical protein [Selenomonadaceae bacterium]
MGYNIIDMKGEARKMNLDNVRRDETGNGAYWINQKLYLFQHTKIFCSALPELMRFLRELENPVNDICFHNNDKSFELVAMIFMGIEAFVNDVYRMSQIASIGFFKDKKRESLHERIWMILKIIGAESSIEKAELNKTGIMNAIREFEQFRNIMFHGKYDKPVMFKYTMFSEKPINCNIIDVLQAMKIAVQLMECFRFIFAGKDIMPHVFLMVNEKAYFEKMDIIYRCFIVPYFKMIMEKHGLETMLVLEYTPFYLTGPRIKHHGGTFVIDDGTRHERISFSREKTDLFNHILCRLADNVNVKPDSIKLPNYNRS